MHVARRYAPDRRGERRLEAMPLAMTYDLREDYERPLSLMEPAGPEFYRQQAASTSEPTPSQSEGSAVSAAAMGRRLGVVESRLSVPMLRAVMGANWYSAQPDLLAMAAEEIMQETLLVLCVWSMMRTSGVVSLERVLKDEKALSLDYGVLRLAFAAGRHSGNRSASSLGGRS